MAEKRIKKRDMQEFTHKGWALGFVPVYVGVEYLHNYSLTTRDWAPEFLLDIAEMMVDAYCCITGREFVMPVKITGELKGKS